MDIIEKIKVLNLPESIIEKEAPTLAYVDVEKANKVLKYLSAYGVSIKKNSEVKWLTLDEEKDAIIFRNLFNRLQWCEDKEESVVDEKGNNLDFVFDNKSFIKRFPDADLTNIIPKVLRDKEEINKDIQISLDSNTSLNLTDQNYDRYVDLDEKISRVTELIYGQARIDQSVTDNLVKILNTEAELHPYKDEDVLLAALISGQNKSAQEIESIKNAISEVIGSLNQGGSFKL